MKINNSNVSIYAGDTSNSQNGRKTNYNSKGNNIQNIFAGNLNMQDDNIELKRKEAMKKALKLVGDVFDGDRKVDDDLALRRNKIDKLKLEINSAQDEMNKLDASESELKELYGITDDSQEQMDLELLKKHQDSQKNPSIKITDEENQLLAKIYNAGITEYQQSSLEIDALKDPHKKIIEDNQKMIICENKTIEGIQLEKLKTHPMVDAQVAADKILDAANGEVIGMLIEESKEHIDQKMEEEKEIADKKTEEKGSS